jgi:hypothetical protein
LPSDDASINHPAKLAIAKVRQLTDFWSIDHFLIGEKRATVLNAARSRKNALSRKNE